MVRLIVVLLVGLMLWKLWSKYHQLPREKRRPFLSKILLWGLLAVIAVLVVTGRLNWIAAAIAASLPLLKGLFTLLLRSLPFLQIWLKKRQTEHQRPPPPPSPQMAKHEAYQILGLQPGASREDIILAHKRLIQKLHPDRGGNDFLAAKLNAAKELLLKD